MLFRSDPNASRILRKNLPPPGMPELEVTEVLVSSHDGAKVPLAILRRKGTAAPKSDVLRFGRLEIDRAARQLRLDGEPRTIIASMGLKF